MSRKSLLILAFVMVCAVALFAVSAGESVAQPAAPSDDAGVSDDPYDEKEGGIDYEEEEKPIELTKGEILKVINGRNGIKACYEKELQTDHSLKGRVVVNFTIEVNGTVTGAKAVRRATKMKNKKVVDCVVEQVALLRFPERVKGPRQEINFPFKFEPEKEKK